MSDQATTLVADFGDPLSFLASQRLDALSSLGALHARFVAVEADPGRPMTGRRLDGAAAALAAQLALPGELLPQAGTEVPNTRAATAAYAESLTDGCPDRMRRALFDALWLHGRRVDDPDVVRQIVFAVLNPTVASQDVDFDVRVRANLTLVPLGGRDEFLTTRRLGFVVSSARGPLTGAGHRRIESWRRLWQAEGCPPLPLVLTPLGEAFAGDRALRWLAALLGQPLAAAPRAAGRAPAEAPVAVAGGVR